jgi:hypothetical protein
MVMERRELPRAAGTSTRARAAPPLERRYPVQVRTTFVRLTRRTAAA